MAKDPTCPTFPSCPPEELAPLVDHLQDLEQGLQPELQEGPEALRFPRGTLLADGRLDLCKQGLGIDGTRTIAKALRGNTFVSSLLLGANEVGDAGATAVADLLPTNPELTTVFLGCNGIAEDGATAIARKLAENPNLLGLWLKRNPLGDQGLIELSAAVAQHPSLRTLDLVHTAVGRVGLRALVDALANANRSVERLFLDANDLQPQDAAVLGDLLRSEAPLRELYLDNNHLGDVGVEALAAALAQNSGLRVLALASNGIGEKGFVALAEAIRRHPSLVRLSIGRARSAAIYGAPANRPNDTAAAALIDALRENPRLADLRLGRDFPRRQEIRRLMVGRLRAEEPESFTDIEAVRSVYRLPRVPRQEATQKKSAQHPKEQPTPPSERPEVEISDEELAACVATLEKLRSRPDLFVTDGKKSPENKRLAPIRAASNRLVQAIISEVRQRKGQKPRKTQDPVESRRRNRQRDQELIEKTGIRQQRQAAVPRPESTGPKASDVQLAQSRSCHICGERYRRLDAFYDALCPECSTLNAKKRNQTADLSGRVALLTGGRIKIGHQAALKLLRAGAEVLMTTRFPCSAAQRFAEYQDFPEWRQRLRIIGIDLRYLPAVEGLALHLTENLPRLDFLINNAAQTIRRPPAFYAHLMPAETAGLEALPDKAAELIDTTVSLPDSALRSQRALLPEDTAQPAFLFPVGEFQEDGQQLDRREQNSWSLNIDEVAPVELLEVHAVNAMVPFLLVQRLTPLMAATPAEARYIVNVSAMEGSFSRRFKSSAHPHTNMAKASLNMLTRTCAAALAEKKIFVNSVDTGWVTDEQPLPVREARDGFAPPLDETDGAARILDPILSDLRQGGLFLKNYRSTEW